VAADDETTDPSAVAHVEARYRNSLNTRPRGRAVAAGAVLGAVTAANVSKGDGRIGAALGGAALGAAGGA